LDTTGEEGEKKVSKKFAGTKEKGAGLGGAKGREGGDYISPREGVRHQKKPPGRAGGKGNFLLSVRMKGIWTAYDQRGKGKKELKKGKKKNIRTDIAERGGRRK